MGKQARLARRAATRAEVRQRGAAGRGRRLRLALFGVLGTLLVGGLVAAVVIATGAPPTSGSASLPTGTQVFSEPDHAHVTGAVSYDRVPPAGGPHSGVWLNCGVYTQPVPNENAVHSLEHGAVWITYQPSLPASQVAALRQLVETSYVGSQRYLILSPYPSLPAPIVLSAWGAQLHVPQMTDAGLGEFIRHYAGGGQGGEAGGECTGGTGSPVG